MRPLQTSRKFAIVPIRLIDSMEGGENPFLFYLKFDNQPPAVTSAPDSL